MKHKKMFLGLMLVFSIVHHHLIFAQSSDHGDGTFSNPVLWGDFPDPDVIRVGNKYYMVSTSMHYFPGVTIMESEDLVNWKIASNAVEEFKVDPAYDLIDGHRYAKGQWATSIRYFNNQFYVLFNTNTEGSFMCTAPSAQGPWKMNFIPNAGVYDPGLFIDHDGRVYVVHGNTDIFVTELTADGLNVKTPRKQIYKGHRRGLEGNRCYHIGDYYYIYCTYGGGQGTQVCLRSKSLYGPFEEREVMKDMVNYAPTILHQGCLIDQPDGSYWSMIFQDHGGLGRIPFLISVNWIDGWPVMGNPMDGNVRMAKPVQGKARLDFPTTDEFSSRTLGLHWQFNHNPDKNKYSLSERDGWLRLYTTTVADSLLQARNTICQRIFGPHSQATIKMDISKMRSGDKTGMVILQDPYATLTVYKSKKGTQLQMKVNEKVIETKEIKGTIIYLRAKVNGVSDKVDFFYSLDDKTYASIGTEFTMRFRLSIFVGNRYGIFNYATEKLGGWVDVDWIKVQHEPLLDKKVLIGKDIEAEYYDNIYNAEVRLSKNNVAERNQDIVFREGGIIAFRDFHFPEKNVNKVEVTYVCTTQNALVEIRSYDTGKIFGTFRLTNSPEETYTTTTFDLTEPLESMGRLELRIWNQSNRGIVAIDKFKFLAP